MFQNILQLIIWKNVVNFFSVYFNPVDTNGTLDIHKFLMKRTWYKTIFGLIRKVFIGLLTGLVNGSNHTKCVSLSNENCMIQHTLISLHPNKYNQKFYYYSFAVTIQIR